MSEEAILNAIDTIKDANDRAHDNLKDIIQGGLSGVRATMDANFELTRGYINNLSEKQAKQNGNVARLQEEAIRQAKEIEELQRMRKKLIRHRKNWLYFAIGAVLFVVMVVMLYDAVGFRGIIELIK